MQKGFKAWKKYAPLCASKYAFIEGHRPDDGHFCLLFINKPACLHVIESHLRLFQEVLDEKINADEILRRVEISPDLFATLKHHQGLLGILLGFGKNNSLAFHAIFEKNLPYKCLKRFNEHEYAPPFTFYDLNFVVIENDLETAFLREKYKKQREQIIEAYRNGDFLEVTFSKLQGQ